MKKITLLTLFITLTSIAFSQAKTHYIKGEQYLDAEDYTNAAAEYIKAGDKINELENDYQGVLVYNLIVSCVNMAYELSPNNIDLVKERLITATKWMDKLAFYDRNDQFSENDIIELEGYLINAIEATGNNYYLMAITKEPYNKEYLNKAIDLINYSIKLAPDKAFGYTIKGCCYDILEDFKSSKPNLEKSIKIYENAPYNNHDETLNISNVYMYMARLTFDEKQGGSKKDTEKALNYLAKGMEVIEVEFKLVPPELKEAARVVYNSNKNLMATMESIIIMGTKDNPEEALESAKRVLENDSNHYFALFTCGIAYIESDFDMATSYFKKNILLDSSKKEGYFGMGLAHLAKADRLAEERGNHKNEIVFNREEGLKYIEKAHSLAPSNKLIIETLIKIYDRLGEKEKEEHYKTLLKEL